MSERAGGFITTYTGLRFYIDREDSPIVIDDIVHALSHLCRFSGHARRFYSVAEHCVRMFDWARENVTLSSDFLLAVLLHDATEAYLGDVTRPLKKLLPGYTEIEQRLATRIEQEYDLPRGIFETADIKHIDNGILAVEGYHLLGISPVTTGEWCGGGLPLWHPDSRAFVTMTSEQAAFEYQSRFVQTRYPPIPAGAGA